MRLPQAPRFTEVGPFGSKDLAGGDAAGNCVSGKGLRTKRRWWLEPLGLCKSRLHITPMLLPAAAAKAGADLVMVDTAIKDGRPTFNFMSGQELTIPQSGTY